VLKIFMRNFFPRPRCLANTVNVEMSFPEVMGSVVRCVGAVLFRL
jgi:hypothetical protein